MDNEPQYPDFRRLIPSLDQAIIGRINCPILRIIGNLARDSEMNSQIVQELGSQPGLTYVHFEDSGDFVRE